MKKITKPALVVSLLMGGLFFLAACSSTGIQRSDKSSASMAAVEQDIKQASTQIDLTGASLDELVRPGQSNVKEAFKKYSDNVDKMNKVGTRLLEHSDHMNDQGTEYFSEWRKEGKAYTNPEIRALSEQRRADLTAIMAQIPAASVGIKGSLKAYLSNLKEIRTYLSNDLTQKGIETITPVAQTAVKDGERLKASAQPLVDAIGNARAAIAHPSATSAK